LSGITQSSKSATGVIRTNGENVDLSQQEQSNYNPRLPSKSVSHSVDNGNGTVTTYYDDGSNTLEDDTGAIIEMTPAPSSPPAGAEVFDDGSYIQTFDDGSQLIVDATGNITEVPAQDPVPPMVYESNEIELSSTDWGEEYPSYQSEPVEDDGSWW
jgi:hypothetical protein